MRCVQDLCVIRLASNLPGLLAVDLGTRLSLLEI